MGSREISSSIKRVVIKLGSSTLLTREKSLDSQQFRAIAWQIAVLKEKGFEVILVSSGAIAAGRELLGLKGPPRTIPLKQACAATGQRELMNRWEEAFRMHGIKTAQVLLTKDDVNSRARFVNARNTFETLFRFGVIPVVNENDTVAVDEIRLGDNDHLSALVANLTRAEILIMLTDTDGLYTADPAREPTASLIPLVEKVDEPILALAGKPTSDVGRGGMHSKVRTAAMAADYGTATVVAGGRTPGVLNRLLTGEELGTFFTANEAPLSSRKHWIAYSVDPKGAVVLDQGAVGALRHGGHSLLPSGITAVEGDFGPGDPVRCLGPDGQEIARGLSNYGAQVLGGICGKRSDEIHRLLGADACEEAIHRDDLVLLNNLRTQGEDRE